MNADPARNLIRSQIESFIRHFEHWKDRASGGEAIRASEIHGLDSDAKTYLENHVKTYTTYEAKMRVQSGWGNAEQLSSDKAVALCEDRLTRLRQVRDCH